MDARRLSVAEEVEGALDSTWEAEVEGGEHVPRPVPYPNPNPNPDPGPDPDPDPDPLKNSALPCRTALH